MDAHGAPYFQHLTAEGLEALLNRHDAGAAAATLTVTTCYAVTYMTDICIGVVVTLYIDAVCVASYGTAPVVQWCVGRRGEAQSGAPNAPPTQANSRVPLSVWADVALRPQARDPGGGGGGEGSAGGGDGHAGARTAAGAAGGRSSQPRRPHQ